MSSHTHTHTRTGVQTVRETMSSLSLSLTYLTNTHIQSCLAQTHGFVSEIVSGLFGSLHSNTHKYETQEVLCVCVCVCVNV